MKPFLVDFGCQVNTIVKSHFTDSYLACIDVEQKTSISKKMFLQFKVQEQTYLLLVGFVPRGIILGYGIILGCGVRDIPEPWTCWHYGENVVWSSQRGERVKIPAEKQIIETMLDRIYSLASQHQPLLRVLLTPVFVAEEEIEKP